MVYVYRFVWAEGWCVVPDPIWFPTTGLTSWAMMSKCLARFLEFFWNFFDDVFGSFLSVYFFSTDEGLVLGRNRSRFLALFVDACM